MKSFFAGSTCLALLFLIQPVSAASFTNEEFKSELGSATEPYVTSDSILHRRDSLDAFVGEQQKGKLAPVSIVDARQSDWELPWFSFVSSEMAPLVLLPNPAVRAAFIARSVDRATFAAMPVPVALPLLGFALGALWVIGIGRRPVPRD